MMLYPSKADEFKDYLKDYIKADREIAEIEKNMNELFASQDKIDQWNEKLSELQERKREDSIVMKYEFKVNIQQELESGRTPLQVMQSIRKQYPEPEITPVPSQDTSGDRQYVKTVQPPLDRYAKPTQEQIEIKKKEESEQKKTEPESQPLVSETLSVTHHVAQPHRAIDRYLQTAKEREERETHHEREQRPSRKHGFTIER